MSPHDYAWLGSGLVLAGVSYLAGAFHGAYLAEKAWRERMARAARYRKGSV